jgi:hypothetical protein
MATNKLEAGQAVVQTNDLEMQFLRLDQVRGLLETLGEASYYARDYVSEENIYHSLNVAAEELERVKENLYKLVFDENTEN